jgi:hypothetical protein
MGLPCFGALVSSAGFLSGAVSSFTLAVYAASSIKSGALHPPQGITTTHPVDQIFSI